MTFNELTEQMRQIEDSLIKIGYSVEQLRVLLPQFGIEDNSGLQDILKITWHLHMQVLKKFETESHNILNPDDITSEGTDNV